MLLQSNGVFKTNCDLESTKFSVKSSAVAFDILTNKLYSDPISAVIRELFSNAWEAHVLAQNTDQPLDVHIPNGLDQTFTLRDYGTGLSKEDCTTLYTTLFDSTKNQSNEFTGAFGLGSKAPFSYVNAFRVTSYHNGLKMQYMAVKADSAPELHSLGDTDTTEPNGLEISLTVNKKDINAFYDAISYYLFCQNEIKANIAYSLGEDVEEISDALPASIQNTLDYSRKATVDGNLRIYFDYNADYGAKKLSGVYVKQGLNTFCINNFVLDYFKLNSIDDELLYNNCKGGFNYYDTTLLVIIDVPVGSLDVTPSRESLQYTDKTNDYLRREVSIMMTHLRKVINDNYTKNRAFFKYYIDTFLHPVLFETGRELFSPNIISGYSSELIPHNLRLSWSRSFEGLQVVTMSLGKTAASYAYGYNFLNLDGVDTTYTIVLAPTPYGNELKNGKELKDVFNKNKTVTDYIKDLSKQVFKIFTYTDESDNYVYRNLCMHCFVQIPPNIVGWEDRKMFGDSPEGYHNYVIELLRSLHFKVKFINEEVSVFKPRIRIVTWNQFLREHPKPILPPKERTKTKHTVDVMNSSVRVRNVVLNRQRLIDEPERTVYTIRTALEDNSTNDYIMKSYNVSTSVIANEENAVVCSDEMLCTGAYRAGEYRHTMFGVSPLVCYTVGLYGMLTKEMDTLYDTILNNNYDKTKSIQVFFVGRSKLDMFKKIGVSVVDEHDVEAYVNTINASIPYIAADEIMTVKDINCFIQDFMPNITPNLRRAIASTVQYKQMATISRLYRRITTGFFDKDYTVKNIEAFMYAANHFHMLQNVHLRKLEVLKFVDPLVVSSVQYISHSQDINNIEKRRVVNSTALNLLNRLVYRRVSYV